MRKAGAMVSGCFALLAVSLFAPAVRSERVAITGPETESSWSGEVTTAGCLSGACTESVVVDVPDEVFAAGYRLQVTVIASYSFDRDIDLEVVTPGGRSFRSSDPVSSQESVRLPAGNGTYSVRVIATTATRVAFSAVARLERPSPAAPGGRLVPNLIAAPARSAAIGCKPEEQAEGAQRCLRFEQIIGNIGLGAFELRYDLAAPSGALRGPVVQRVHHLDGTYDDRRADTYEFHPTHAHFHYAAFAQSHLWLADDHGVRLGDKPIARGRKNGFCMADSELIDGEPRGSEPRRFTFAQCYHPPPADPSVIVSGISVGWFDVYGTNVTDQYIEISSVPEGLYIVETHVDPGETVEELDDGDNCAAAMVRIGLVSASIVRPLSSCG